jgi:aryl-alcohol dehydrogenase-like predicted oxidoreductase
VARLDALLLHEPASGDVDDALVRQLDLLKRDGKVKAIGLATAPESTAAILDAYPGVFDVIQIPVAGASRIGPSAADTTAIVHSVLGQRLEKSLRRARKTKEAAEQFEADTGVAPADRDGVAKLLLRAAMARNPGGVTLFSSSRPDTVKSNAMVKPLDAQTAAHVATLLGE